MAAGRRGGLPEELFLLSWALTDGQNNKGHSVINGGKSTGKKKNRRRKTKDTSKGSSKEPCLAIAQRNKGQ